MEYCTKLIGFLFKHSWLIIFLLFCLLGILEKIYSLYFSISTYNSKFWGLGGKISRKNYIINQLFLYVMLIFFSFISLNANVSIKFILCVPIMSVLHILIWNNVYKRLFDISDKMLLSFLLSIFFMLFVFIWGILKSDKIDLIPINIFTIGIDMLRMLFYLLLFILPSKQKLQKRSEI